MYRLPSVVKYFIQNDNQLFAFFHSAIEVFL